MATADRPTPSNPYLGPSAFETKHADLFFGRNHEIITLADLLLAERIVVLHSPSGAGKTSLIQAGLLPRLQDEGFLILPTIRVNQPPPSSRTGDASESNRYVLSALLSLEARSQGEKVSPEEAIPLDKLARMSLGEYLALRDRIEAERSQPEGQSLTWRELAPMTAVQYRALQTLSECEKSRPAGERIPRQELARMTPEDYRNRRGRTLDLGRVSPPEPASRPLELLIFDQFEEILTADPVDERGREEFFVQLAEVLRRACQRWALFAIRDDYLAELAHYARRVPTQLSTTFALDFLRPERAAEAIRGPANQVYAKFRRGSSDEVDKEEYDFFSEEAAHWLARNLQGGRSYAETGEGRPTSLFVEPVQLQVVCFEFWERLFKKYPDVARVEMTHIRDPELADVDNALARYFARRVASAARDIAQAGRGKSGERARGFEIIEREIREWFEYDLITSRGRRDLVPADSQGRPGGDVVRSMIEAYLVREVVRHEDVWLELAHDRLIQPLKQNNTDWFHRELAYWQVQAARWDRQGHPPALQLSGQPLAAAERWALAHADRVTDSDWQFLRDSTSSLTLDLILRSILYRNATWILSATSLILLALVIGCYWLYTTANHDFRKALSSGLQLKARNLERERPDVAMRLSLGLLRMQDDRATRSCLVEVLESVPQLTKYLRNEKPVSCLAFSPDGKLFATGGGAEKKGFIILRDAVSQQPLSRPPLLKRGDRVTALAFSLDGKWLASGDDAGIVLVWEVGSLNRGIRLVNTFDTPHKGGVKGLAFSPSVAGMLATAGKDEAAGGSDSIRLWDVASGKNLTVLPLESHKVTCMAFSPDGKSLAAGGQDSRGGELNGKVQSWSVDPTKPDGSRGLSAAAQPSDGEPFPPVQSLAFGTYRSRTLLAVGCGGQIRGQSPSPRSDGAPSSRDAYPILIWNFQTWKQVAPPLTGHRDKVTGLAFSRNATSLASCGEDRMVRIWDIPNVLEVEGGEQAPNRNNADSPVPNSGAVPVGVKAGPNSNMPLPGHNGGVTGVAFGGDDRTLASGDKDGSVILWDIVRTRRLSHEYVPPRTLGNPLIASPDGRFLATADPSGRIRLDFSDNPVKDHPLAVLDTRLQKEVTGAIFSLDGAFLMAWVDDGSVVLFNVAGITDLNRSSRAVVEIKSVPLQTELRPFYCLAFSPNRDVLATGGMDGSINLWDATTGKELKPALAGNVGDVTDLIFTQDGKTLASAHSDGTIILWNVVERRQLAKRVAAKVAVRYLAIRESDYTLAYGCDDGSIRFWDVKEPSRPRRSDPPLKGHRTAVVNLRFSKDGRKLASASLDASVVFWDFETHSKSVKAIDVTLGKNPYPDRVSSLFFDDKGQELIAAYFGGGVVFWDADRGSWRKQAAAIANLPLMTDKELENSLSSEP
ncbi:MAG: WD40 repeat domain-containing protein [Isosphaerales bacterium]